MAKDGFYACAHTCGHVSNAHLSKHSRRLPALRNCFVFPKGTNGLKNHASRAQFHPKCSVECQAFHEHNDTTRIWSRQVSQEEWNTWAQKLAIAYPHLIEYIPAMYLKKDTCGGQVSVDDAEGFDALGHSSDENVDSMAHLVSKTHITSPSSSSSITTSALSSSRNTLLTPTRGAKRKFASYPATSSTTPISSLKTVQIECSRHWAADGNLLVQLEDVRFKLHRSRLAKLSSWFRGTFTLMEKETKGEWDDTTHVIHLDGCGCSAHDFEVLLDALDSVIMYFFTPPPFDILASILRASTSLSFTQFKAWSTHYLQEMWSPALADVSTTTIPFAKESVLLARQCPSIRPILKRALYELVRADGLGQDDDEDIGVSDERKLLLKARERLTSIWVASAASLPGEFLTCSSKSAQERAVCVTRNLKSTNKAHAKLKPIFEQYKWDPVCGFEALMEAPWREEGFCEACIILRKTMWQNERKRCWTNLDKWFELDTENDE